MSRPIEPIAPPGTDDFLSRLGARVRAAREDAGQSRRALAARTGISERHLAHLELGTGNISIALLQRVATAMDLPVAALVEEPDPLVTALRAADDGVRRQVRRLLSPDFREHGRVALIGLRGSGKSTLGRRAAQRLGLPFRELNTEIEQAAGISVSEVFALYGSSGYRRLEREALDRLVAGPPMILAVAGGITSDPGTFQTLLDAFRTVWLRASPIEHMNRVRAQGDERPMAGNPAAMAELRTLLIEREADYARANHQIDTSGQTVGESLEALVTLLQDRPAPRGTARAR